MDFASLTVLLQNEYVLFVFFLVVSLAVAFVTKFVFKTYLKRLAGKTKTELDDVLIESLTEPVFFSILLAGAFLAFRTLSVSKEYAWLVENVFFIALVLVIAFALSKIFSVLITHWFKVSKAFEKTPRLISKIVSVFVFLIAFLLVLSRLNVEITPLIATLGVGGLALGLALQSTLSNFFAGLHIISDKQIKVGDFIELPEKKIFGYIDDIGWRSTRIKTVSNALTTTMIIIPNSLLADSIIVNKFMFKKDLSVVVDCGVAYGSNLNKVERIVLEVAKKVVSTVPGAVKEFEPFVRFKSFGDSNINFSVTLKAKTLEDSSLVIHEFIKALKERFDKENIEISWPVRKIYYGKQGKGK